MPRPKWKDLPLAACKEARAHFFTPEMAELTEQFDPEVDAPEHVGRYLTDKVFCFFRHYSEFKHWESPVSIADFLQKLSPVFHSRYLHGFEDNCNRFDRMISGSSCPSYEFSVDVRAPTPRLSDIFIKETSFTSWITDMCFAIAFHCYETVSPGYEFARRSMPTFASSQPPFQAGVIDDGGPIKQVTLVGPSLNEAWNRLPFTRNMENECSHPPSWTPRDGGGLDVYHGTAEHLRFSSIVILQLAHRPFDGMMGESKSSQVTHGARRLHVVWTAFSPFCAFLRAVFKADVIDNLKVLGTSVGSEVNKTWQYGNKTYEGVLLFQFSSTQPCPYDCSSYTIPMGQEESWSDIAAKGMELGAKESSQKLWEQFITIHETQSEWPDLVHGRELYDARRGLRPFTNQFWRTVWYGQGIETLNSRHKQSLAIRYIIKPDSLPPSPMPITSSTKEEHDKVDTPKKPKWCSFKRLLKRP